MAVKIDLCIITGHYPFGVGEEFLEDELRVISPKFNNIFVLSLSKNNQATKFIPENAKVIRLRKKRFQIKYLIYSFVKLFSFKSLKEIRFAIFSLRYNNLFMIIRRIFIYWYFSGLICSSIKKLNLANVENTLFYSYWLDSSAFALTNLKAHNINCKCVSRAHGGDAFIERGYLPFRREVITNLDQIHSVSEAGIISIRKNIVSFLNNYQDKLILSRLGIIRNDLRINPPKTEVLFRIVSCSNIIPLKRLDLIIESLSMLPMHEIEWVHFGDGSLSENISNLAAKKLMPKGNIRYKFQGRKIKSEIYDFYATTHIDLFINVSDYEGIPVSIMEALSYGIPVIARDVGGNREIVNSENGILLPANVSSGDICENIMSFYNLDINTINDMRLSAVETYLSTYSAEKNYYNFYLTIIDLFT